jgi:hypothetical protein
VRFGKKAAQQDLVEDLFMNRLLFSFFSWREEVAQGVLTKIGW